MLQLKEAIVQVCKYISTDGSTMKLSTQTKNYSQNTRYHSILFGEKLICYIEYTFWQHGACIVLFLFYFLKLAKNCSLWKMRGEKKARKGYATIVYTKNSSTLLIQVNSMCECTSWWKKKGGKLLIAILSSSYELFLIQSWESQGFIRTI